MRLLAIIPGLALILVILWDAFETIILPRRVTRRFRLTRVFYQTVWAPWSALARSTRNPKRRPDWLAVTLERGPFRRFEGEWNLKPLAPWACKIEFVLRYDFGHALASSLTGKVFDQIAGTFVDAYVARADAVYGTAPEQDFG